MNIELTKDQVRCANELRSGCILRGDTGVGKSRTAIAWLYTKEFNGELRINGRGKWKIPEFNKPVYIITTAQKRDSYEWEDELENFYISTNTDPFIIDSWNNIAKYTNVYGAVFIFDEHHATGVGKWSKRFIKIAKKNRWIILTATPGDKWIDYWAVFVANGFYKNKTEFINRHAIYKPYGYGIDYYIRESELERHRRSITVQMKPLPNKLQRHSEKIFCHYDKTNYKKVFRKRWNIWGNHFIEESGEMQYCIRRVVNEDPERLEKVFYILDKHKKVIIFYNFIYEKEMLKDFLESNNILYSEYNGQIHDPIPEGESWVYLCNYGSAAEGWNCLTCDTIIFYSLNYSYRTMKQAAGRIDRGSATKFKHLYYYYLASRSPIDLAILKALKEKRNFNAKTFFVNKSLH